MGNVVLTLDPISGIFRNGDISSSIMYKATFSVCDNSHIVLSSVSDYVHDKFSRPTVKYTF